MEYTITSHNDDQRSITVLCNGYEINVAYPEDAQAFDTITEESLQLLIGGIIAPYADMAEYTDPNVTIDHNKLEWF